MSRKRSISTDISTDTRLAELAEFGTLPLLLYTWAIPHADDWGRMSGDARQFKLLVCPALDVTAKEINEALDQVAQVGLWQRYEADGKKCIAFPFEKWMKHQSYINAAKRQCDRSAFPPPPGFAPTQAEPEAISASSAKSVAPTAANTAEQRTSPQNAEERRKTPQNTASPSPSPSPSVSTDDREGMQGESAAPEPSGLSVEDVKPETSVPESEVPRPSPAQGTSPRLQPPRHGPETKADRQAFITSTLAEHPDWRDPLESRVVEAKPADPDKYRAAVLRNWLSGDGTPAAVASDADGYDAPYHRPAQIDPVALEREMERKRLREESRAVEAAARSQNAAPELGREAVLRLAQTGMLPGALPAFRMPA